jgi:hypothetical protein
MLFAMSDVAPGYHGGDGSGDPPPPGGWGRGTHEQDGNYYLILFTYCCVY